MEIRERLEEEMTKCYALKLFKNRVRKCNEILPDCVLENVFSFIRCDCKRCDRTRRAFREPIKIQMLRKQWEGVDVEEISDDQKIDYEKDCIKVWFYYFQELNNFPWKSTIYKRFKDFDESDLINCQRFYELLYLKNFKIWRGCRLDHTLKNRDFMLWMISERGCQFYPQIFDEQFSREIMTCVFGV